MIWKSAVMLKEHKTKFKNCDFSFKLLVNYNFKYLIFNIIFTLKLILYVLMIKIIIKK